MWIDLAEVHMELGGDCKDLLIFDPSSSFFDLLSIVWKYDKLKYVIIIIQSSF